MSLPHRRAALLLTALAACGQSGGGADGGPAGADAAASPGADASPAPDALPGAPDAPAGPPRVRLRFAGPGGGRVVSTPAGLDCIADCDVELPAGEVRLAATAAAGSRFAGWSGACTGDGACTFTLGAADAEVTATFEAPLSLDWYDQIGSSGGELAGGMAADGDGHLYAALSFSGTVDLDGEELTSAGATDALLVKYDLGGDVIWHRQYGGTGGDQAYAIAIGDDGDLYLGIDFEGEIEIGDESLSSAGDVDIAVARLSPDGDVRWAVSFGSTDLDFTTSIAERDGMIALTGAYGAEMSFGGDTFPAYQYGEIYVLALRSSDGGHLWSHGFGNVGVDAGIAVAIDADGHVAVGGRFQEVVDFGGGERTARFYDAFVAAWSADGDYQWDYPLGGTAYDDIEDMTAGADGRLYAVGEFRRTVTIGGTDYTSVDDHDLAGDGYVLELSPAGAPLRFTPIGGIGDDGLLAVAVDAGGNLAVAGEIEEELELAGETLSGDDPDLFVARLDPTGEALWAGRWSGPDWQQAEAIAIDSAGGLDVAEIVWASIDLGAGPIPSAGGYDVFITRFAAP